MADGIVLNLGVGGDTAAADEISGQKYSRIKLVHGVDGVNDGDIATTNPLPVKLVGSATNGVSAFKCTDDLDESEEEVKSTAGTVFGVVFTNTGTSTVWLKFYNATAANVTVGTTAPYWKVGLPGNATDDISGVLSFPHGIKFDTAICVAVTTGYADNDTGAPAANTVPTCTILYV
jgi:hypothetical protein